LIQSDQLTGGQMFDGTITQDSDYQLYLKSQGVVLASNSPNFISSIHNFTYLRHVPLSEFELENYWSGIAPLTCLPSLRDTHMLPLFQNLLPINRSPLQVLEELKVRSENSACVRPSTGYGMVKGDPITTRPFTLNREIGRAHV
jgi:hypothetical protein